LVVGFVRGTEWVAHREVDEQRAWGVDQFGEVPTSRYQHRRDTGCFHDSCYQTNCLVVEGSSGHQEEQVDAVGVQLFGQGGCCDFGDVGAFVNATHEPTPEPRRD